MECKVNNIKMICHTQFCIDLTRMECKEWAKDGSVSGTTGIDLTRMECKVIV